MQGKVEICGVNTAKLKVLKNEEMTELLKRVKAGDQEARQRMIEGNLRLVLSVIQRFAGAGREYGRPVSDRLYWSDQSHRPL